jgi:hypothetical protein
MRFNCDISPLVSYVLPDSLLLALLQEQIEDFWWFSLGLVLPHAQITYDKLCLQKLGTKGSHEAIDKYFRLNPEH